MMVDESKKACTARGGNFNFGCGIFTGSTFSYEGRTRYRGCLYDALYWDAKIGRVGGVKCLDF